MIISHEQVPHKSATIENGCLMPVRMCANNFIETRKQNIANYSPTTSSSICRTIAV